jgi:hypothetical protein
MNTRFRTACTWIYLVKQMRCRNKEEGREWLSGKLLSLQELLLCNKQAAVVVLCSRNIRVRLHHWQILRAAEMCCVIVVTPDLYPVGPGFKFRPGDQSS